VPAVIVFLLGMLHPGQNLVGQDLPAKGHATRGISLAQEGKLPEAEKELQEAVRMAPSVASYRAQLGAIRGLQEKWKEALNSLQKAVDLAPEDINFRRETAAVQWQLGLMPPAENNLRYILAKHPGDSGAILLLGLVKERTGDYVTAAQLLDSQFQLVTSHPDRMVALFHSLEQSGQHDKITRIVDALKLHTNLNPWMDAIKRCTQIAALAGDLEMAEALFALIPDDDAGRPAAGFQLAKLLYNRAQVPQAKELLLQLKSRGIENADVETLLGSCLESERQPEQAIAAYRRAIEADPSHIDRYEDLISLLLYQHRTADAELVVKQARTIAPKDSRPWVWKGNVDLRRNDYKVAMESYRHAVQLDRGNPDALFGVAAAYYVTGQNDAAISECKTGISRFPNDARFYVSYAEMVLASPDAMQRQVQAKDLLVKALKLAPQSAQAHYLLGQISLQQGQLKEAEEHFLHSLSSDPDRSKTHFALSRVYRRMGRADQAAKEIALYQELKGAEESGNTSVLALPEKQ
jgi:tetratricopeptide (TPR) repeat protein